MKINDRLKMIGDLVEANSFCLDVGCDHAFLDIYLVKRKDNIRAIASDIAEGPVEAAKENIKREVKTSLLNEVIQDAYQLNLPPSYKGKRLKIYFTSQTGIEPPKFTFRVNNKGLVHFSYERYLENKIRENIDFSGTPIVIQFKNKGEKEL